jgi:predicted aspartyl protease
LPRCLAAIGLALIVAACDGSGGTPGAHPEACSIEQTAVLAVRFVQGSILVPASINHRPAQLVVDTGASSSLLTPDAVDRLHLPADPHRSTTLHGIGGSVVTRNALVRSFEIGGLDWQADSIATGELGRHYQEDPPVDGLLGADFLHHQDVELDIPHGRIVLWRVQHCAGDFLTWQAPHFVIPLLRYQPNRMVAHVRIDGQPVTALIDWGARFSTITIATATALGVTPGMLALDRPGSSHGVDQNELPVHAHRFTELSIGAGTFRNIAIQVADLQVTDVGMLLGADYVRSRRVWLSYATEQMFVERIAPVPPPTPTASR